MDKQILIHNSEMLDKVTDMLFEIMDTIELDDLAFKDKIGWDLYHISIHIDNLMKIAT